MFSEVRTALSKLSGSFSGGRKFRNPFFKNELKRSSSNPQSLNKPPEPPVKPIFKKGLRMRSTYSKGTIIINNYKKSKENKFARWFSVTSGVSSLGSACWMAYDYKKGKERAEEHKALEVMRGEERRLHVEVLNYGVNTIHSHVTQLLKVETCVLRMLWTLSGKKASDPELKRILDAMVPPSPPLLPRLSGDGERGDKSGDAKVEPSKVPVGDDDKAEGGDKAGKGN